MSKKNNNKPKFRRNNKPSKPKEETYVSKENNEEKEYKFRNHPSDFIPNELIRKQVGSFSYNNTIGMPIHMSLDDEGTLKEASFQVPSVMEIDLFSSIGSIKDISTNIDGINTSGKKYYNILSSINAKTTNYQPQDISLVELLVGDLLGHIANAMRIYGVVFNFNPRNRTVPDALVKAMGINPGSFGAVGDVSAYRMRLNRLITVANGIKFVKDINIFKRSWELFSRIFIDENSSMGQYYVFRPYGYWSLTEALGEERAKWHPYTGLMDAEAYLDDIEEMIDTLLSSSLFNYIYTDILNYQIKKGAELLSFAYVPELVQVFGVYDQGILNQIHNMSWCLFDLSDYKIYDDVVNNKIQSTNPISATNKYHFVAPTGTQILDQIYTDQPTYDDNVDALAFKSAFNHMIPAEGGKYTADQIFLPDHPVCNVTIHSATGVVGIWMNAMRTDDISDTWAEKLGALLPFKVAPIIYYVDKDSNTKLTVLGNLNFFTTIEPLQLENMFNYYYLGLYDVEVKDVKEFQ